MKRLVIIAVCCAFRTAAVAAQSVPATSASDDSTALEWMRRSAVPLRSLDAGNGFADLEPLRAVLRDVRVVGLGESTHGSSEFQRVKLRLLEFLVKEMGFTALAIEAPYSDAEAVNAYVLHGVGSRSDVVTGLGYIAWDTEEFAAMIDWLREYNRAVPAANRVHFYGMDLYRNGMGRRVVQSAVRVVAPELAPATDSLFRVLAEQEALWPLWDTTVVSHARPQLDTLAVRLAERRQTVPARLAAREWDAVLKYVDVMQRSASLRNRSRHLGENLLYILDHDRPDTKVIVSAANSHVATGNAQRGGYTVRERLGNAYYSLGFGFYGGTVLCRRFPPKGELLQHAVPVPASGSWGWYLARVGPPSFFLDFRAASDNAQVDSWLRAPREFRGVGWACPVGANAAPLLSVRTEHDGILFVTEVTPTHPTPNARASIARRANF